MLLCVLGMVFVFLIRVAIYRFVYVLIKRKQKDDPPPYEPTIPVMSWELQVSLTLYPPPGCVRHDFLPEPRYKKKHPQYRHGLGLSAPSLGYHGPHCHLVFTLSAFLSRCFFCNVSRARGVGGRVRIPSALLLRPSSSSALLFSTGLSSSLVSWPVLSTLLLSFPFFFSFLVSSASDSRPLPPLLAVLRQPAVLSHSAPGSRPQAVCTKNLEYEIWGASSSFPSAPLPLPLRWGHPALRLPPPPRAVRV